MLNTDDNKFLLDGNGIKTEFEFDFKIFKDTDLKVSKINKTTFAETPVVLNVDYTVQISRIQSGGKVIFITPPTDNEKAFGYRDIAILQPEEIPTEGSFPEVSLENALDRSCMISQQLQEQIDRTLKTPSFSDITEINIEQPIDGRAMYWEIVGAVATLKNANSNPDDIVGEAQTLADAAAASAALAQAATGVIPTAVNNTYWKRNSSGVLVNMTPEQVREDLDPVKISFGDITSNPTFVADSPHEGFIKASIAPSLPSATANKLKNILFDFNIQPGRTFTAPTNVKWDYSSEPTFAAWPDLALNIATINNMALTFPATSGQYADFKNVPFKGLGSQTWERIWNITPTQIGVTQQLVNGNISAYSLPLLGISSTNHFLWYLSSNGSAFDISNGTAGTYTVANNTDMYVKEEFTGTQYKLSTSMDYNPSTGTGTWTADITINSTTPIYSASTSLIRLGMNVATPTTNLFKGSVNLSNSSVKINGGRNLLTPEPDVFLNRIIWDTMNGGSKYKAHYSQIGV